MLYRRKDRFSMWELVDPGVDFCMWPGIAVADRRDMPEPQAARKSGHVFWRVPILPPLELSMIADGALPSLAEAMQVGFRTYELRQCYMRWTVQRQITDWTFEPPLRRWEWVEEMIVSDDWRLLPEIRVIQGGVA